MKRYDFHTHSTFSDGADTPEEMVIAAIGLGLDAIGFSEHSYTSFDEPVCMHFSKEAEYQQTIRFLKEKYAKQIKIYCGIEQDYFSDKKAHGYDYIIGSVHYVKTADGYLAVDDTPEILQNGLERYFNNDIYLLTDAYWSSVANVHQATSADIIGHLDLIRKFNRNNAFFDESSPRYLDSAFSAVDSLIATGLPFEINTGAISRGYQTFPYPSPILIKYIKEHGGHFILSSDSHRKETLCYGFQPYDPLADFDIMAKFSD